MKPVLYPADETAFNSNGIGVLNDCISCTVTEERNEGFECKLTYPIDGQHYSDIKTRTIVMVQPRPDASPQPFRVYRITRPVSGIVTVYAQHISYDLTGIVVRPFRANGIAAALSGLKTNASTACPFDFWTDINDATGTFETAVPASIRSCLGGMDYSILDMYGGEFEWDRYTVKLHKRRGADRGFTIRYGKNLVDMTQEENIAQVYTGVFPYWSDNDGNTVTLPEGAVKAEGTYDYDNIMVLDCSAEWSEQPSQQQLREHAQTYIKKNHVGVPKVGFTISFAKLSDSVEYAGRKDLERIELCDTVQVIFMQLGVASTATVTKVEYDALKGRYKSITVGQVQTGIHRLIAMQQGEIDGNSSDIGKNNTDIQKTIEYIDAQIKIVNGKIELVGTDISAQLVYVDINNRTLYINPKGKMGSKGTVGGHYGLYQGASGTVDLVQSVTLTVGVLTFDLLRLWFVNGLYIGNTDPSWIFDDGGEIGIWDGN